jgi:hypothetical protein
MATIAFPPALAEAVLSCALREAGIVGAIERAVQIQLAARGLLNKAGAAKFLEIEERTLEIWMRAAGDRGGRGVPHYKIGEAVRFKLAALEAWCAQYEINKVLPKVA